jgi:hypothetical protein
LQTVEGKKRFDWLFNHSRCGFHVLVKPRTSGSVDMFVESIK